MKLAMCFVGEIDNLKQGINEIIGDLGATTDDSGVRVIVYQQSGGLSIVETNGDYLITYEKKADFFRALAILCDMLKSGKAIENICEKRKFKSSGVMIDCSRNAVLKLLTIKNIFKKMACMGLNMAMLYTEDTYEIDGYPYFGYMRGLYTKDELREIDKYASLFGIELIPCIQTLAHLRTALRWPFAEKISDRPDILLVDEPETYKFISAMFKTFRECFSTNRIHIGMDEAHDVGLGNFLNKHGYQNRFDIISRHLSKVSEIAEEFGFEPMMWSDMFFRLGSKTGNYYDLDAVIPADLYEKIPANVSQVFWDYSHEDSETYKTLIKKHFELKKNIIFAGSIWSFCGLGINYSKTFRSTHAAMKACREIGVDEVFATIWGDDGGEVNVYATLLGMQLYAEYIYYDDVKEEHLRKRFKQCTGYNMDAFLALEIDNYPTKWCHPNGYGQEIALTISKQVFYQDLLLGLFDKNFELIDLKGHYKNRLETLRNIEITLELKELFEYYKQLLSVLYQKCDMGIDITRYYKLKDKNSLKKTIEMLHKLYDDIVILRDKFSTLWHETNKTFGFERIDIRMGGVLARIETTKNKIENYINGTSDCIEELDVEKLMYGGDNVKPGKSLVYCHSYENIAVPARDTHI